jgi:hypothetical protein
LDGAAEQMISAKSATRHDIILSPRQRAHPNSPGFYHEKATREFVQVSRDNCRNSICFGLVRQFVELKQDHAMSSQLLADNKFAEVAVLSDQDAAFILRSRKDIAIRAR